MPPTAPSWPTRGWVGTSSSGENSSRPSIWVRYICRQCNGPSRTSPRERRRDVTSTGHSPTSVFSDDEFDLALCSHFLFTHSDQLSVEFHVAAIEEMCRVAVEARVFPLLKGYGGPSPYLKPVLGLLRALGYHTGVRKAPYEFQRGGDEMLVAKKPVPQGIGCG